MKIVVKGEMTLAALRQALFEQLIEIEESYAVRHSRNATLYINPTNGSGDDVIATGPTGRKIEKIECRGPYDSAASDYKL